MSEEPRRLSLDPAWAADLEAVKAARPDPTTLGRVERRLQVDLRGGAPRPLHLRLRWAILLGVFGGATAVAALGREGWWPNATEPQVAREPVGSTKTEALAPPAVPDAAAPMAPTPAAEPAVPAPSPASESKGGARPPPRPRPEPAKVAPAPSFAPPPPVDPLAAQLSALKEAQVNLQKGDAGAALRQVEALLEQHPSGPLAPEARVLRVQALAAAGQVELAVAGARVLIEDPTQRGKRGEWWRFIGDLERGRARCPAALEAYRAAAASPLKPASKQAVEAGIQACGGAH